jgi:hypothetical protein
VEMPMSTVAGRMAQGVRDQSERSNGHT